MTTYALILMTTLPVAVQAQTTILPAAVDGAVQSSGVLGLTVIDGGERNDTLRSGGNNIRQSIYEFDFSSIASNRVIEEAYLEFDTRTVFNIGGVAVFRIDGFVGDGVITTSDFDVFEAGGGTNLSDLLLVGADSSFESLSLALTDFTPLQDAITNGDNFYGLRTETNNFATIQVSSLENTVGAAAPSLRLVLTPIPEPSVMSLAFLGCLGLFARRR